jgi:hypothetical protein
LKSGKFFFLPPLTSRARRTTLSSQSPCNIDVALSASHGIARFFSPDESKHWPFECAAQDFGPLEFSPTNVGVPSGVQFQPLADINVYPNHYPAPAFFEGGENYLTQPLVFGDFNVAPEEFQSADFNAALTSTAIDVDFPAISSGSASTSAPYSLANGNDLNDWGLPAGLSNSPGDGEQFTDGSTLAGDLQGLNPDGGFVDTGFGFPTSWTPNTSVDGNFQSNIASNDAASSSQGHNDNMIWDLSPPAASVNQSNLSPDSSLAASTSAPPPPPPPAAATASDTRIPCTYPPCTKNFKRDYERIRYENSMHLNTQGTHLCPITGCSKSQGKGYSRSDKVTEHLWKKHGNLGYTKA